MKPFFHKLHPILSVVLLATACSQSGDQQKLANTGSSTVSTVTQVLDGTDLIDINEVKRVERNAKQLEGTYKSEQGGSLLYIAIIRAQEDWAIERAYIEPGQPKAVKRYRGKPTDFGMASEAGDIAIQGTAEGVLVFEADSGVSAIPNSYWVHYLKDR